MQSTRLWRSVPLSVLSMSLALSSGRRLFNIDELREHIVDYVKDPRAYVQCASLVLVWVSCSCNHRLLATSRGMHEWMLDNLAYRLYNVDRLLRSYFPGMTVLFRLLQRDWGVIISGVGVLAFLSRETDLYAPLDLYLPFPAVRSFCDFLEEVDYLYMDLSVDEDIEVLDMRYDDMRFGAHHGYVIGVLRWYRVVNRRLTMLVNLHVTLDTPLSAVLRQECSTCSVIA